jgi:putative transposase
MLAGQPMTSNPKSRKRLRLPHYDYSTTGAYFLTICVKNMKPLFAQIQNKELRLSDPGKIAEQTWLNLPNHYANIKLDEFIIMPNHMHGILWILDKPTSSQSIGEGFQPSLSQHALPEIIRGFKTYSARKINRLLNATGKPIWQRSFHEHIIRNDDDLLKHRTYIQNNPLKWALDEYYK